MSWIEWLLAKIWLNQIVKIINKHKEENKNIENFLNDTLYCKRENDSKYIDLQLIQNEDKFFISRLYEFLKKDDIVIVWNPWSWKTELLIDFWLQYKEWIDTIKDFKWFIPFYIPLKVLWTKTLEHYIQLKIQQFYLKWDQKFFLLLDWLDEIDTIKSSIIFDELNNLSNHKIVISSRKTSSNLWYLNDFNRKFNRYEIEQFDFKKDTSKLEEYFAKRWKKLI